jgi:ribonuclease HII
MLLIGIDEVGYGCRLGPFVVSAVVWETPQIDLWGLLGPEVVRDPRKEGVAVCDSKRLYSTGRLGVLERSALAFLPSKPTLHSLCAMLGGAPAAPWTETVDLELPCAIGASESSRSRESVCAALERSGAALAGVHARILEPFDFNEGLRRLGNKHDLHVATVLQLLKEVLDRHDSLRVTVQIGKLSARTFYLSALTRVFAAPTFVRRETRRASTYVMDLKGREIELSFILDGDDSCFSIALASIVGKYLRECRMKLFNEYWAKHFADLRPTAGYGSDAMRFWRDIRGVAASLGVAEETVLRAR